MANYRRHEIEAGWKKEGAQGNKYARKGGETCVLVDGCKKDDALILSALFVEELFAMPTCCYYDDFKHQLSIHCGEAGSRWMELKSQVKALVAGYFAGKHGWRWPVGM